MKRKMEVGRDRDLVWRRSRSRRRRRRRRRWRRSWENLREGN